MAFGLTATQQPTLWGAAIQIIFLFGLTLGKRGGEEKSDFFSSVFADNGNGAGLVDPELAPRSGMWMGQHNNQPMGGTAIHRNNLRTWAAAAGGGGGGDILLLLL